MSYSLSRRRFLQASAACAAVAVVGADARGQRAAARKPRAQRRRVRVPVSQRRSGQGRSAALLAELLPAGRLDGGVLRRRHVVADALPDARRRPLQPDGPQRRSETVADPPERRQLRRRAGRLLRLGDRHPSRVGQEGPGQLPHERRPFHLAQGPQRQPVLERARQAGSRPGIRILRRLPELCVGRGSRAFLRPGGRVRRPVPGGRRLRARRDAFAVFLSARQRPGARAAVHRAGSPDQDGPGRASQAARPAGLPAFDQRAADAGAGAGVWAGRGRLGRRAAVRLT